MDNEELLLDEVPDNSIGGRISKILQNKPFKKAKGHKLIKKAILVLLLAVTMMVTPVLAMFGKYGAVLFIFLPTTVGFLFAMILSLNSFRTFKELANKTATLALIFCAMFIVGGMEGIICIVMAIPVIVPLMLLGAWLAFLAQKMIWLKAVTPMFFLVMNPAVMFYDLTMQDFTTRTVTTEKTIHASDARVWQTLTQPFTFGESDYLFLKRGVSYPIDMKIENLKGQNYLVCTYSNGHTNARIDSLVPNKVMRFAIDSGVISMKETSIYPNIEPSHIRTKLLVNYGEFRLKKINDSTTLLQATTQYSYKVGPERYWSLWSDYLFNKMHHHVLDKITTKTEAFR